MPEIADVVIVGGGILGTMIAYELSLRAMRVVILEAHALASGTSGSGFAWINASSKDENEAYHRFNADAVMRWRTLRERTPHLPGLHGGGSLYWTAGGQTAQRTTLRGKAAQLQSWGYPLVSLSRSELLALEPAIGGYHPEAHLPADAEGVFFPSEMWLETGRVIRFVAELTRKLSADIREYLPLTGVVLNAEGRVSLVRTAPHVISFLRQEHGRPLCSVSCPILSQRARRFRSSLPPAFSSNSSRLPKCLRLAGCCRSVTLMVCACVPQPKAFSSAPTRWMPAC
jgi:glycine/D-amino acid oxidase-like deaminating enzyme